MWRYRFLLAILWVVGFYVVQFAILSIPEVKAASYTIASSARFNSADSAYLSRTPGVAGNRKTWTWSGWVKRSDVSTTDNVLFAAGSGVNSSNIGFSSNLLRAYEYNAGVVWDLQTTPLYRDPAAWMHVVVAMDTTQPTAANRLKIYIDGKQVTAFGTATYPTQNSDNAWFNNTNAQYLGVFGDLSGGYLSGYLSDVYFIDGQALTPSSFGETDSNGYWRPKSYTGTYGTNGFKLDFANGSSLGTDVSGNANNWTVNNMDATDQVVDTPTKGYATHNPLKKNSQTQTFAQGNLEFSSTQVSTNPAVTGTIGMLSGKWYWESYVVAQGNTSNDIGVANSYVNIEGDTIAGYNSADIYVYEGAGTKRNNAVSSAYGNTWTTGDLLSVAFDADNGKVYFAKNCTFQNISDPAAGTNPAFTGLTGRAMLPYGLIYSNGDQIYNYGQSKNSTSTATTLAFNSAADGYFYCTPPTGYKALSTANLPTPAVTIPQNFFNATEYRGQGVATSTRIGLKVIYLTSGATTTVPSDWNSSDNTIEVIGGGGGGRSADQAGGGGGGAYSRISNLTLTTGASVSYAIGSGGAVGTVGGDTYFCNSTSNCASIAGTAVQVGAKGGSGATGGSGASGGAAGSGVGTLKYSGGTGGAGGTVSNTGGGGGGGAGGPNGAGKNGGDSVSTSQGDGGGGGGGHGGGGVGGNSGGGKSGDGGNNVAGVGGGDSGGLTGGSGTDVQATNGGGGYGGTPFDNGSVHVSTFIHAGAGSAGVDMSYGTTTAGSGGGGGGGASAYDVAPATVTGNGAAGGNYGGGGGGGATGGAGAGGVIVITYMPSYASFQPDFVWIKSRSSAMDHNLFDAVRGVKNWLASNLTNAEVASSTTLTTFDSKGFSLGTSTVVNKIGDRYISWNWKESATSGFDIVTYTGTGAAHTIAHSLGVTPDFIVVKRRDAVGDAAVYHQSQAASPQNNFMLLDSTAATAADSTYWNNTAPTASVFSVGTNANVNTNTGTYVAYLFASTTGFSSFGSYTGNSAADGPFVYTGFKPRFVMFKEVTGAVNYWQIDDTARTPTNPAATFLSANRTDADSSGGDIDMLSNGFKVRSAGSNTNTSGSTYIYAAFAEIPFKYSAAPAAAASTASGGATFLIGMSFFLLPAPFLRRRRRKRR